VNAALPRLAALVLAFAALVFSAFWITRESVDLAPGESGLTLGMAWLKREYQLDDATFERVTDAHRRYFRECEKRCHELEDVNNHFLSEVRSPTKPQSDLDAVQLLQESICHDCRLAMIEHVHEVASLMPPEKGRRFIADVRNVLEPSQVRGHRRSH
jgi:hypothetical protein